MVVVRGLVECAVWDDSAMSLTPASRCNVLLSGGIDSALVAALLCSDGWSVQTIWVDYGQPAAGAERAASRAIAGHYGLDWHEATVRGVAVPPQGEITGRNDMLVATGRACAPGLTIAIGVHAGTPYADCSTLWLDAWRTLLDVQHSGMVTLLAPLAALHKPQVLALARECGVPFGLTHSCETGPVPCGRCLSCQDRQAAVAGA
jgi:7-cyano-7-deazaguanine synthase